MTNPHEPELEPKSADLRLRNAQLYIARSCNELSALNMLDAFDVLAHARFQVSQMEVE